MCEQGTFSVFGVFLYSALNARYMFRRPSMRELQEEGARMRRRSVHCCCQQEATPSMKASMPAVTTLELRIHLIAAARTSLDASS